jgi:polar amino acid transport system ATP-binding protein
MKSGNELITIKGLHKYYSGNHVLRGIDLTVDQGEMVSIIGRSGCGKTTLLRCLNCLEMFDDGQIHIAGITLTRYLTEEGLTQQFLKGAQSMRKAVMKPFVSEGKEDPTLDEDLRVKARALRMRVGMLFQNFNLFGHLTVMENVMLAPVIVQGKPKKYVSNVADELLDKVGLFDFKDRYPHELSGGQAQRVAIARALAMNPQVMLYDEPTSALDPELVGEVLEVMKKLHKEGMTQIIVTHAMGFARNASNRVVYMEEGKVVEIGTPGQIFDNPRDERTKLYLQSLID